MNGMNEWMMQANEQQCLNELLAQPEEEAALTLTGAQALQGNPAGGPCTGRALWNGAREFCRSWQSGLSKVPIWTGRPTRKAWSGWLRCFITAALRPVNG